MVVLSLLTTILINYSNILLLNIVFYIYLLLCKSTRVGIKYKIDIPVFLLCIVFFISVLVSMLLFYFNSKDYSFGLRELFQFAFTLQYGILSFSLYWQWRKFENAVVFFAALLATLIIIMFFVSKTFLMFKYVFFVPEYRMWGSKYFPIWPNTTGIPILFGVHLIFKRKKRMTTLILIMGISVILTTSRGAILGLIILVFNQLIRDKSGNIQIIKVINYTLLIVIGSGILLLYLNKNDPTIIKRLFLFSDRARIFETFFIYIKQRPLFGFGGNTLDQVVPDYSLMKLAHLHNWVLEISFRYGIVGLLFFIGMLCRLYKRIIQREDKVFYLLLLFMALFQTFIRNFVFLFIFLYLIRPNANERLE